MGRPGIVYHERRRKANRERARLSARAIADANRLPNTPEFQRLVTHVSHLLDSYLGEVELARSPRHMLQGVSDIRVALAHALGVYDWLRDNGALDGPAILDETPSNNFEAHVRAAIEICDAVLRRYQRVPKEIADDPETLKATAIFTKARPARGSPGASQSCSNNLPAGVGSPRAIGDSWRTSSAPCSTPAASNGLPTVAAASR